MYEKINQITVEDKKLNVYAILNDGSPEKYLYDLFVIDNKVLKRKFTEEIIKTTLVSSVLLAVFALVLGSSIHAYTSDVMARPNALSLFYLLFWTASILGVPLIFGFIVDSVCSFLSFFNEEDFVNNLASEEKTGGFKFYAFSHLNFYSDKKGEKAASFVEFLRSLKVSELEEIFHNTYKTDELQKKREKIRDLLDNSEHINGLENELRNKLHHTDEQLDECQAIQEKYENKIKEFYDQSIKEKTEKEIVEILAS